MLIFDPPGTKLDITENLEIAMSACRMTVEGFFFAQLKGIILIQHMMTHEVHQKYA